MFQDSHTGFFICGSPNKLFTIEPSADVFCSSSRPPHLLCNVGLPTWVVTALLKAFLNYRMPIAKKKKKPKKQSRVAPFCRNHAFRVVMARLERLYYNVPTWCNIKLYVSITFRSVQLSFPISIMLLFSDDYSRNSSIYTQVSCHKRLSKLKIINNTRLRSLNVEL